MQIIEKSLGKLYPDLAREWHPTKNKEFTPFQVTPGSGKKVWWKCNQGHEWRTTVASRTSGSGCQECWKKRQGKTLSEARIKKRGSLAEKNPELAKEWHPTRNEKLTPHDVTVGSGKKVWWKCNHGHEWKAVICSRASGCGCPYCSGRMATKENNLKIVHPELAKQWHPTKNKELTPAKLLPASNKKVWWKCSRGHEWKTSPSNRQRGTGCPYCNPQTSKLEIRIYCEFLSLFNKVKWLTQIDGIECDIFLPEYNVGIELDGYPWHEGNEEKDKQKGEIFSNKGITLFHVREVRLKRITQRDIFYINREKHITVIQRILKKILQDVTLSKEAEGKISEYLRLSQIKNSKEYRKIVSCLPGPIPEKSLLKLFPETSSEWDYEKNAPLIPSMFSPGSQIYVWWRCSKGHEWRTRITDRTSRGRGCPFCAGQKATEYNNLAVMDPELAKEWHPTKNGKLTPYDVMMSSGKEVWWKCNQGHEWKCYIYNRTRGGQGCPYCAGKRASEENNLAIKNHELAKEWHPTKNEKLTPYDVTPASGKKVWWICEKGHEWRATVHNRKNGRGCPYCVGKKVGKDNNLAINNPELIKEWNTTKNGKLTPFQVTPKSNKKVWWICHQGHEWDAIISSRTRGNGCPYCSGRMPTKDNNLAVKNPELAKEWHPTKNKGLKPFQVTPGSTRIVWWICNQGHEWKAVVYSRNGGTGCPHCAREKRRVNI